MLIHSLIDNQSFMNNLVFVPVIWTLFDDAPSIVNIIKILDVIDIAIPSAN